MSSRLLTVVRVADAAGLLLRSSRVSDRDAALALASRVLGARQVLQAVLLARSSSSGALRFGAAVDGSHSASMLVLAARSERWRRPALQSAAISAALAFSAYGVASRQR